MSTVSFPVRTSGWVACLSGILIPCGIALAQGYSTNFEPPLYTGSAAGTVVTGQDGWYLPAAAMSQNGHVFTYAGNALSIALNPLGGLQFEGGLGVAAGPVRAQHPVNFSPGGIWRAEWDCTGRWNNPAGPAVNNIGSWSLQPSTAANPPLSRYFQQLMSWGPAVGITYVGPFAPPPDHTATFQQFHIHWGFHTAADPATIVFSVPGPEWLNLDVNNWHHISVTWDFDSAQILSVSISNITTGGPTTTTDVTGLGWYLQGGPNSTLPLPTDVRLFAGGAGDVSAWDNLSVTRLGPCDCPGNLNGDTLVNNLDTPAFVAAILNNAYDVCADVNKNGGDNGADIAPFVQLVLANGGAGTTCPALDVWATEDGPANLSGFDFGSGPNPPIPAGFFGPGSDPFVGTVALEGRPIDYPSLGPVDTIVKRPAMTGASPETVPIELIQLSLVSIAPITVTGGPDAGLWNVHVNLSPTPAPPGPLTAMQTAPNGGIFDSTIFVQPLFIFVNDADLNAAGGGTLPPDQIRVRVLDTGGQMPPIQLQSQQYPFARQLCPQFVQDNGLVVMTNPGAGFVPGIISQVSDPCQVEKAGAMAHVFPGERHYIEPANRRPGGVPPSRCSYNFTGLTRVLCPPPGIPCPPAPPVIWTRLCPPLPCPPFVVRVVRIPCGPPGGFCLQLYALRPPPLDCSVP